MAEGPGPAQRVHVVLRPWHASSWLVLRDRLTRRWECNGGLPGRGFTTVHGFRGGRETSTEVFGQFCSILPKRVLSRALAVAPPADDWQALIRMTSARGELER